MPASRFIYCRPPALIGPENQMRPGIPMFSNFFKLYGGWVLPIDRTGTITTPVRSLSLFPVPALRLFTKTYEDVCNERARAVLLHAEKLDTDMHVFWSGGIDSTCLLVSLLKNATPAQKKRIVVLLSHESIMEYPDFFDRHIRGNLRAESSTMFPYFLGGNSFILSGENNDQVMGSDKVGKLVLRYGASAIHKPYKRELFFEFFGESFGNDEMITNFYLDLFERLRDAAPVPLRTNFEYLWWINFALKWQAVFAYTLMFTAERNVNKITREYIGTNYMSFYNTDDFQLWSLNNLDRRIKDTWPSYKWVAKDVIYDFTKDAEYRDKKTKKGSRAFITRQQTSYSFLDENLQFSNVLPPESYLRPDNDFA